VNRTSTLRPERVLVVQLARFGDFLQTTPLLTALKAQQPEGRLSVLVDRPQAGLAHGALQLCLRRARRAAFRAVLGRGGSRDDFRPLVAAVPALEHVHSHPSLGAVAR